MLLVAFRAIVHMFDANHSHSVLHALPLCGALGEYECVIFLGVQELSLFSVSTEPVFKSSDKLPSKARFSEQNCKILIRHLDAYL